MPDQEQHFPRLARYTSQALMNAAWEGLRVELDALATLFDQHGLWQGKHESPGNHEGLWMFALQHDRQGQALAGLYLIVGHGVAPVIHWGLRYDFSGQLRHVDVRGRDSEGDLKVLYDPVGAKRWAPKDGANPVPFREAVVDLIESILGA